MSPFEYLSVLLSVILGLAITQVLQGYRSLLLSRSRIRAHWPTLVWSVLVLLFATQSWWASFGLEARQEWRFDIFGVILLQMALLYILAAVILPDVPEGGEIHLEDHFETQRRPFFCSLLLVLAVSLLKDLMLQGSLPETPNVVFHLFLAGIAAVGLLTRKYALHVILALAAAASFVAYVTLLFARL